LITVAAGWKEARIGCEWFVHSQRFVHIICTKLDQPLCVKFSVVGIPSVRLPGLCRVFAILVLSRFFAILIPVPFV
jgi:hypothetical protein